MYTRQRLVDLSDISIKQINDNFSAIFLKLSGNIDTIDLKNDSITNAKIVDGAITADKINVGEINIGHLDEGFIEGLNLMENPVFTSYAEQLAIVNGHVENHATLIQQNASNISLQATAIDGLGADLASLNIYADEISSTVTDNRQYVDNYIVMNDEKVSNIQTTISNQWSEINQRADSIESKVGNISETVTQNYSTLDGKISSLNTTVIQNHSSITQRADSIESNVSNLTTTVTTNYNTLDGKISDTNTIVSENHSTITQRADAIESNVSTINSNVNSLNSTVESHSSTITQLSNSISSKVSYTDYNGVEIASLINQEADRITISANAIDLTGITTIYSDNSYATFDRYGDFYINQGGNDIFEIYNKIDGIEIRSFGNSILDFSAYGRYGLTIPCGEWDFSDVWGSNYCYARYTSSGVVFRDRDDNVVGQVMFD